MIKTLTTAAALSAALIGSQAGAVTTTGLTPGGTVNLSDGPFVFNADFVLGDAAGTFTFDFVNDFANSVALTLVRGTVLQSTAEFAEGVTATLSDTLGTASDSVDQEEEIGGFSVTNIIAAGATGTLTITFGEVVDDEFGDGRGAADIDFTVAARPQPIPVPAAGLLLAGALGGMAFLRRRKTA